MWLGLHGTLAFPARPLAYLPIAAGVAGIYYLLAPHAQLQPQLQSIDVPHPRMP